MSTLKLISYWDPRFHFMKKCVILFKSESVKYTCESVDIHQLEVISILITQAV